MCLLIIYNITTQINGENKGTLCLICQLILDMFIDKENIDSETSIEIDQHVNEESPENTIKGIVTFQNTHTQLIFDMFIDNEDTVEVEQQDSLENTMQGIVLFKVHTHFYNKACKSIRQIYS